MNPSQLEFGYTCILENMRKMLFVKKILMVKHL